MIRTLGKTLALITIINLLGNQLYSTEWEFGLKAGMGVSKAGFSRDLPYIALEPITEFFLGSHVSCFFIKDQLGIQSEINYSIKGFDVMETGQGQNISSKYKISYIEIPVLISYKIPLAGRFKPGLIFGPYFGLPQSVREKQTVSGEAQERKLGDNLKKTDIGLVFGGNIRGRFGSLGLIFDVRYSLGLVNISKDIMEVSYDFQGNDTIKNRAFTVSLGVSFNPRNSRSSMRDPD